VRRRSPSSLVPYLGVSAAVLLAIVAVVSAYIVSERSAAKPGATSQASQPSRAQAYPGLILEGAFHPEAGPGSMAWQRLGDSASIKLAGAQPSWLAFRALSRRSERTLTFIGADGERLAVRIATRPRVYLVGPLSSTRVALRSKPVHAVASPKDRRRSSILLATLHTFTTPVVALPGEGFWGAETSVGGVTFNWLARDGMVDVYAPHAAARSVWLTFTATSIGEPRSLIAGSGSARDRALVPVSSRLVKLGPFPLIKQRARIRLRTSPGPNRYGADPRLLSVQVAGLAAQISAAEA
jgi:hypothetical protein